MTKWEKKRDEMRRKIAHDTRIVLGVMIASAAVSVMTVFRLYHVMEEKELQKDFLLLQQMKDQNYQKQR